MFFGSNVLLRPALRPEEHIISYAPRRGEMRLRRFLGDQGRSDASFRSTLLDDNLDC
jgi:hypothetical protein